MLIDFFGDDGLEQTPDELLRRMHMAAEDYEPLRTKLAPHCGERVKVTGYYDHSNTLYDNRGQHNKTSLIQECEVQATTGQTIYVGHVWVQRAAAIMNARPLRGSKIEFTARVGQYLRRLKVPDPITGLMTALSYNLNSPGDVEIIEGGTQPKEPADPVPPPSAPKSATNHIEFLRLAKQLAEKIGPDTAATVAPHLTELVKLAEQVGGAEQLAEYFQLLS